MEKFTTLAEAAKCAGKYCSFWRFVNSNEKHDPESLAVIASVHDEENPLDEADFYLVARNGALGQVDSESLAIDWLFLPLGVRPQDLPAFFSTLPVRAFCTRCGRKAREGASFCAGCGNKLV